MKRTFAEILEDVKKANAGKLIRKAHSASRLAKLMSGKACGLLYEAKAKLMCRAMEIDPEDFTPSWTNAKQSFVLLRCRVGPSLHAPVRSLSSKVTTMIEEYEARIA
jgi:hypothetical protein